MDEKGVKPSDIRSIDDISKLPFTNKTDLRDNYPFGLFAAPMKEIVRIHASSGTTGKPTTVGYTKKDIENWQEALARCLTMSGVSSEDIVQVSFGYGLFTGGLGFHSERKCWVGCRLSNFGRHYAGASITLMSDFGSQCFSRVHHLPHSFG
jgi:phenylacetate-CoA ligase